MRISGSFSVLADARQWLIFQRPTFIPGSLRFSHFYVRESLVQVFPEARVILTQRSSESWQKSMQSSLLKVFDNFAKNAYI